MKFSSLRYLTKEGFRSIWQNKFMALASIGVLVSCLLLTGSAYLFFVNVNKAFDWIYGQNVIVAYAKEDCTDEQLTALQDKLKGITNVESVQYISKDEVLEKYEDAIPDETYQELQGDQNPCYNTYVVTFKDLSLFNDTLQQIEQISEVDSVSCNQDIAATLTKMRQIVLYVGGGVILLLFLVSLFIIINTIKLTVYNRRLEISIMKSVGATNAFVRIPFVVEGIILGIVAGAVGYGILYLLYNWLSGFFHISIFNGLVSFSAVWGELLSGFLLIGVLTGIIGSVISIGKYLKDEGGISGVI